MSSFWEKAGVGMPYPSPAREPEAVAVDVGSLTPDEFAQHRQDVGIRDSDFMGASSWSRETRAWQPPREEKPMDSYREERAQHGLREAPQASAMPDVQAFRSAQWAAINEHSNAYRRH